MTRRRPHVLFLEQHDWPQDTSDGIVSHLELLIWGPLQSTGMATHTALYVERLERETGRPWGDVVSRYIADRKPDLVMPFSVDAETPYGREQYEEVARTCRRCGIPVVMICTDPYQTDRVELANSLLDHVDYHLPISPLPIPGVLDHDRYLYLWTPADPRYYYRSTERKDIPLSFIGERMGRPERAWIEPCLKRAGVPLLVGGGRGEERLSTARYAQIQRTSQMGIDVFSHPASPQLKGRVFELTACHTLLLEMANAAIELFFEPDVDYISVHSPEELVSKCRFYLDHEGDRTRIAHAGWRATMGRYTPGHFWSHVFDRVLGRGWR